MTMVNIFFRLPPGWRGTIEELEEAITAIAGYAEVHEVMEYNGEIGTAGPGDGFRVYVHISSVADIVEACTKGIGAELLVAW